MKCPRCLSQGKEETCRIVRRSSENFLKDIFRCFCREVYSREELIMAEEERIDKAFAEAMAIDESNRSQEVDLDDDDIGDDPIQNGWVGRNGQP